VRILAVPFHVAADRVGDRHGDRVAGEVGRQRIVQLVGGDVFGPARRIDRPDNVGTVIDVMLSRTPVPLLVVREAFSSAKSTLFERVALVISGENEAAPAAAAKALALLQPGGTFTLSLILEEELYENFRKLMQAMHPDMEVSLESVTNALIQTHMRLHRGLQQAAAEQHFKYDLQVKHVDEVPQEITQEHSTNTLQALGLVRSDHHSQGVVNDRIRFSADPLLIVAVEG